MEISDYVASQDYEKVQRLKKKINTAINNNERVERSGRFLNVNEKTQKFIKFKDLERLIINNKKLNKKLYRHVLKIENLKGSNIKVVLKRNHSPYPHIIEIKIKSFQDVENLKFINYE